MNKLFVSLIAAVFSLISLSAGAGSLDISAKLFDNTAAISKAMSKTVTTTGNAIHLQAFNVTDAGYTNTIATAIGDAGIAYIINNSTGGTVQVGFAAETYVLNLKAGEFAVLPLASATAAVYLLSSSGQTNSVELYVHER